MDQKEKEGKSPAQIATLLGVDQTEMHVFICIGPDCCAPEQGEESWNALKRKIKADYPKLSEARIYRTKVGCLRICKEGPIALSYPQGKWFRNVTADQVEGLVDYLASGEESPHPLEFKSRPLPGNGK